MDIFLSAEIEGPITNKWFNLQKIFSEKLRKINDRNYGDNLTSIAVISILMREQFFEDGGYKERKYYSVKRKEADIRLRIDYKDFMKASAEKREMIYRNHILESIQIAGEKAGKGFDTKRLLSDVEKILSE